ncbi:Uncharacterised protein [uncultured archaeon]|nr:Uncharacterised protein [uncultured archaeon]
MALQRIIWEEHKERFVDFHNISRVVFPTPIGFPTGFLVCNLERDGIKDEQAIEEHAPRGANAYCAGNVHAPNITDSPQRSSYEVQYYRL